MTIAAGIPVLLYHSVSRSPSSWIARYTVSPETFGRHMEMVTASGRDAMTVSGLRAALRGERRLPDLPVVITFDDGFADTLDVAAPILARHGLSATVYLTTGVIGGVSPGGETMLDWEQVAELLDRGHELGGHTHTHPQLDTVTRRVARGEITRCKEMLEHRLGIGISSFAYPFGYSTPALRHLVADAGYQSACSVKNAFSPPADPPYSIARLAVTGGTTDSHIRRWLSGEGARVANPDDTVLTRAWRSYRRTRAHVAPSRGWEGLDVSAAH